MVLPKVAVVGSCTSRDAFSRRFAPQYKEKVELVETIYQSSLLSLARESPIIEKMPSMIQPKFHEVISREFSGKNLGRLALAAADVVIIDLFADIHFGVTRLNNACVTRNHMAFCHPSQADMYFSDEKLLPPHRMRYEAKHNNYYRELAITSIKRILAEIYSNNSPLIVLNSARMSYTYRTANDSYQVLPKIERLKWKNNNWDELDDVFQENVQCARIEYPRELLVGDEQHPWGKHPVHYRQNFYSFFWNSLDAILRGS